MAINNEHFQLDPTLIGPSGGTLKDSPGIPLSDLFRLKSEPQPLSAFSVKPQLKFQLEKKYAPLEELFRHFFQDIQTARGKLVALNPGRRKLIERRLEFIARKLARSRNEKFNRTLVLTDIIRESFRFENQGQNLAGFEKSIGLQAWYHFSAEAALYHVLELFFLNALDRHGLRKFETSDITRMNFAAHSFLSQKATSFAHPRPKFQRTGI